MQCALAIIAHEQVLDQVDANLSALDALHWRETTPSGNLQVLYDTHYCHYYHCYHYCALLLLFLLLSLLLLSLLLLLLLHY
jgi:hypothetical protein